MNTTEPTEPSAPDRHEASREEFIDALYTAGWRNPLDAQHHKIVGVYDRFCCALDHAAQEKPTIEAKPEHGVGNQTMTLRMAANAIWNKVQVGAYTPHKDQREQVLREAMELADSIVHHPASCGKAQEQPAPPQPAPEANRVVTCVYCGHEYPDGTPTAKHDLLTAHIKACEKHPMRDAEARIERLRKALSGLVGAETKKELEAMDVALRIMPGIESDKIAGLNAIHALLHEINSNSKNS